MNVNKRNAISSYLLLVISESPGDTAASGRSTISFREQVIEYVVVWVVPDASAATPQKPSTRLRERHRVTTVRLDRQPNQGVLRDRKWIRENQFSVAIMRVNRSRHSEKNNAGRIKQQGAGSEHR